MSPTIFKVVLKSTIICFNKGHDEGWFTWSHRYHAVITLQLFFQGEPYDFSDEEQCANLNVGFVEASLQQQNYLSNPSGHWGGHWWSSTWSTHHCKYVKDGQRRGGKVNMGRHTNLNIIKLTIASLLSLILPLPHIFKVNIKVVLKYLFKYSITFYNSEVFFPSHWVLVLYLWINTLSL